jgi:hypothetical protein
MAKPTLDLDVLIGGTRVAQESPGNPFYVITFGGGHLDLRTQDRMAAQTLMMGLVGFDEVAVTLRTFASLEELDYHERFEKKPYEEKRAFENDWRRWMDYEKREEARELRKRTGLPPLAGVVEDRPATEEPI